MVYTIGVFEYDTFSILGDAVALASIFPPLQIFICSYLDALFAG